MTNVQRAAVAWSRRFLVALVAALVLTAALVLAAALAASVGALPFQSYPYEVRDLNLGARPYSVSAVLPREDPGVHDRYGVRMRPARGVLYDFPRGQSTYGLLNLSSYLVTDDQFYLDRALAQATRLRETRVVAGEAWYYPNRPSKDRHGEPGESIAAPYYSALAQGRVLMFFARLAEVTGDAAWRDAADHTFASLMRAGPRSGPYVANVDSRGFLWLQEWPWPGMRPDDTFNGHNSAAFGIYEYWHLTKDAQALEYFRGAATTAQRYAGAFRNPGWLSFYCRAHHDLNPFYHNYHVGQLLELYRMTGAVAFARYARPVLGRLPAARPLRHHDGRAGPLRRRASSTLSGGCARAGRWRWRARSTTRVTRRTRLVPGGELYLRLAGSPAGAGGSPSGRGGCTRTRRRRCAPTTPSAPWRCSADAATGPSSWAGTARSRPP